MCVDANGALREAYKSITGHSHYDWASHLILFFLIDFLPSISIILLVMLSPLTILKVLMPDGQSVFVFYFVVGSVQWFYMGGLIVKLARIYVTGITSTIYSIWSGRVKS